MIPQQITHTFRSLKEQLATIVLAFPIALIIIAFFLMVTLIPYQGKLPAIQIFLGLLSLSYLLFIAVTVLPENYWSKIEIYLLKKFLFEEFGTLNKYYYRDPRGRYGDQIIIFIWLVKLILYFIFGYQVLNFIVIEDQHWDLLGITMMFFILSCHIGLIFARALINVTKLKDRFDRKTTTIFK